MNSFILIVFVQHTFFIFYHRTVKRTPHIMYIYIEKTNNCSFHVGFSYARRQVYQYSYVEKSV